MSRTINRPEWTQYIHNGNCFGFGYGQSGVASTLNVLQIWNPVGSGVRIVVFAAQIASGSICQTLLGIDSVLATLATVVFPSNLLAGSAVTPKAYVTTSQPTAIPATSKTIRQSSVAANTKDDVQTPGSICELPEGFGLNLATNTTNVTSFAHAWWAEIPKGQYA